MNLNKRGFLGAAAMLALVSMPHAYAADSMVLKSADVHPLGYPTVQAVENMGKKLEEATGGRLSVQMYPSMQLGGEKETLEQVQVGALAMTRVSVGVMGPIVDDLNVFNLPFVFRSVDQMHNVIDGEIGDMLLQKITDDPNAGLIGLAWMDAGTRSIYNSKKAVEKMEDLAGLKIRTMGNPMFVDMANAMGANGISMGFDQLINAMQTGVVDGAENNYPTYSSGQHYNYAPYYSTTEHLMIPEILVFSKKVWDTLSPEDQALVLKFGKETQLDERSLWMAKEQESLEEMKANGVTVTVISPEEKKRFQDAMKPVWDKYGGKYADLLQKIQAVE